MRIRRVPFAPLLCAGLFLQAAPPDAIAQEKIRKEIRIVEPEGAEPAAKSAWLGVVLTSTVNSENGEAPKGDGVRISQVTAGSPAEKAGLKSGDVVTSVDGDRVEDASDVVEAVSRKSPGDPLRIEVRRDGRSETLRATLGSRKDAPASARSLLRLHRGLGEGEGDDEEVVINLMAPAGKPRLGVTLQDLTDQLAEYFGARDGEGVLVSSVLPDTPAARAGVEAGDVIVNWNGRGIEDGEALRRLARKAEKGETVRLGIVRRGAPMTIEVTIDTDPPAASGIFLDGCAKDPKRCAIQVGPGGVSIEACRKDPKSCRILFGDGKGLQVNLDGFEGLGKLHEGFADVGRAIADAVQDIQKSISITVENGEI